MFITKGNVAALSYCFCINVKNKQPVIYVYLEMIFRVVGILIELPPSFIGKVITINTVN